MELNNHVYYLAALALVVVVAFIIKKVTSCMVKLVLFLILLATLGLGYYFYLSGNHVRM